MNHEDGQAERWKKVEQIYIRALEIGPDAGAMAALLDEVCAGDLDLRRSVESLLRCEPLARNFIETSALEIAADLVNEESNTDLVGRRIGPYVVEAWLGAGGMGEVYRARDTNLHRDVALKILPAFFAFDSVRASGTYPSGISSRD